jgi:hypothetical protein
MSSVVGIAIGCALEFILLVLIGLAIWTVCMRWRTIKEATGYATIRYISRKSIYEEGSEHESACFLNHSNDLFTSLRSEPLLQGNLFPALDLSMGHDEAAGRNEYVLL